MNNWIFACNNFFLFYSKISTVEQNIPIVKHESKYARMDQVKFVEDSFWKIEGVWSA